jgi:hypothetical protein
MLRAFSSMTWEISLSASVPGSTTSLGVGYCLTNLGGSRYTRYLGWLCIYSIDQISISSQGSGCLVNIAVELFANSVFQLGGRLA